MEKLILTVEDVADALQMSSENVLRLVRNRKLRGRKERGRCFVYQHSLKDYVLSLIATRFKAEGYITVDENEIKKHQSRRQTAPVIRLSNVEGDSCKSGILPEEAVVRLQGSFSYGVFRMGVKDYHLRLDLIQEMSLGTLKCCGRNKRNYYLMRAQSRGWDYLRYERMRGMTSIDSMEDDEWEKIEPARQTKVDCSAIIKLFKLAGIPLNYMQDHEIRLVDEDRQDFVSNVSSAAHGDVDAGGVPLGEDLRPQRHVPPVREDGKEEICMSSDWKESA